MKSPLVLHEFALLLWYLYHLHFLTMLLECISFSCIPATDLRKLEKSSTAYGRKNVEGESSCLREKIVLFYS